MYGALRAPPSSSCRGLVAFGHLLTPGHFWDDSPCCCRGFYLLDISLAILAEGRRTDGEGQLVF
jgi:hypothetical protein